ncbi:LuxR family quorum-sensing system transcriptional regulator SinR [Agrobacterium vitis]|nr:LuxR family quorum-sensing system transcriptional regulator SinR [Agrobacterium vitis]MBE1438475.1 LuxR family quorum-sensing system transcriptional regulator SinR [Agrobacterium vitis]
MFNNNIYFDLLDWLDTAQHTPPLDFLKRLQTSYGLAGCLYIDAAFTTCGLFVHRHQHSFDKAAERSLEHLGQPILSNVLSQLIRAIEPVDMEDLPQMDKDCMVVRNKLRDLNLPERAVSYPLLSHDGRGAIFVIAHTLPLDEWQDFRRCYDRDIHRLAGKFHAGLIKTFDGSKGEATGKLTRREQETLRWTAAGKSYWETSVILGISERTVRYFMANARNKLDAVSNTQAVAKAVWQGLIPPDQHD